MLVTAGGTLSKHATISFYDLVCELWFLGREDGHQSAFTLWQGELSNTMLLIRELIFLVANGVSSLVRQRFAPC